jgi:hypothetical protein
MTKQEITDRMFFHNLNSTYSYFTIRAQQLYEKGASYKKLALNKWAFILKCKKKGVNVLEIDTECGYCFKYSTCTCTSKDKIVCPLHEFGVCKNTFIKTYSSDMSLAAIQKVHNTIVKVNKIIVKPKEFCCRPK